MSLSPSEELELLKLMEEDEEYCNDEAYAEKYIKIVDKQGNQVQFQYNAIQKQIDDKIKELEGQGIPARIIVLKARQEGVSTYTQAKILCKTAKHKNRNALVVAHRDDSTSTIFEKAKYMYNNMPEEIKPLQRASNAKELIFDKPTHYQGDKEGLNSKIKVQTAGSGGIGRSDTYYYIHLSEFAFYGGNPKQTLAGILQAVPNIPGTIVIIESTANGYNDFKEIWDAAVAGENDFVPMFFAWHDYEEYQLPVTEHERKQIMSTLTEYEAEITKLYDLTAEQIKWYRWKLKNDCNNDTSIMKQENPSYPKEAFLSTGRPVFDNALVEMRIEQLKKHYAANPYRVGRFSFKWNDPETKDKILDDSIEWVDDPNGFIRLYEEPKKGYPYVIGGDTKGEGKDFYAGTGLNNVTGNRCVSLRMQLTNSKPFTWQMYCLGRYFNDALIGIEMNFNTAPIEELQRLNYPNQYMRQHYDKIAKQIQPRLGWKTDGNTRPLIIDKEVSLVEEHIELFNDIDTLDEMLTFIYDEDNRPDAQSGKHDDLLISDMIAAEIRPQQAFTVQINQKPFDFNKLPEDLKEDYMNATPEQQEYLLKKWGMR